MFFFFKYSINQYISHSQALFMKIDKYFSSLRNLLCHYVEKLKKSFFKPKKHKFKKPPVLHRRILMHAHAHFCKAEVRSLCVANLGGSFLHSGGSWRPRVPFLFAQTLFDIDAFCHSHGLLKISNMKSNCSIYKKLILEFQKI